LVAGRTATNETRPGGRSARPGGRTLSAQARLGAGRARTHVPRDGQEPAVAVSLPAAGPEPSAEITGISLVENSFAQSDWARSDVGSL
jgi:hypothetical protein